MIKTNSVLRKKWFQITAATVGAVVVTGGAVGGGVAAGIIKVATERAEKKFAQAGIILDPDRKSDIDQSKFTGSESKINVVTLGDSVTAGYSSLFYTSPIVGAVTKGKDVPSYATNVASLLKDAGRLGSYDALAVDGEKTTGMLQKVADSANREIFKKANLIFMTIGANDILQAVKLLGVPYSKIQDLLADPFDYVKAKKAAAAGTPADPLGLNASKSTTANTTYLPLLLSGVQKALNNQAEATFSIDGPLLDTQLKNAGSNIMKSISTLHELAPGAKIVINEYQFPFNRLVNTKGKNITDIPQDDLLSLTYAGDKIGKNTVRGVYDYVMNELKTETTEGFGVVAWNSLQENQDELVKQLTDDKIFTTKEAAVAAFQPDIADIHPSEYSHALIGQLMYNKYLVKTMNVVESKKDFEDIRNAVLAAKTDPGTALIELFFNFVTANTNEPTDASHVFFSKLVDKVLAEITSALNVKELSAETFSNADQFTKLASTAGFTLFSAIANLQAGPTDAAKANLVIAVDRLINSYIFGSDTELYDLMTNNPNAFKSLDFDVNSTTPFKVLAGSIINEAVMSRLSPAQQDLTLLTALTTFVTKAIMLPAADQRSLEAAMPNLPSNTFANPSTAGGAVQTWVMTNLPILSATAIESAPTAIRDDLRNLVNALRADLQAKTPLKTAADAIVALSGDEKDTLGAKMSLDHDSSQAIFGNVSDTIFFLALNFYSNVPENASTYDDTYGAKGKTIMTNLYNEIVKALKYANALATAYPAVFFKNYGTNQKTRALDLGDILFRTTPTLSIVLT